jgi:hypothetical protein
VRAFVGQENVGGAWIVPHNVRMDSELGRYVYEPVLMIDDTAKKHFTVHHTNVVQREVHSTQIYNQGYRYPYYYYVTPRYPHKPIHPPDKPEQPLPPGEMNPPPVNDGAINAQVFAPPSSIVNTRPQVIGTPATSPINARVFAP